MPLDTNGLRAGQIGAMLVEMQRRGLVPGRGRLNDLPHLMHLPTRNGKTIREELDQGKPLTQIVSENEALRERIAIEDAARISALSAEWSAPVVAAQDLLGFHGNTAPDMRETFDTIERITGGAMIGMPPASIAMNIRRVHHMTQHRPGSLETYLSAVAAGGRLADQVGLDRSFAAMTAQAASAFGTAFERSGGLQGVGGLSRDEAIGLDQQLRTAAAASPLANALGAVMAMHADGLIRGGPAMNLVNAIQGRQSKAVNAMASTPAQILQILQASHVSAATARQYINAGSANQEFVARNAIHDTVRQIQGQGEIASIMRQGLQSGMSGVLAEAGIDRGEAAQIMRVASQAAQQALMGMSGEDLSDPDRRRDRNRVVAAAISAAAPDAAQRLGPGGVENLTAAAIRGLEGMMSRHGSLRKFKNLAGLVTMNRPDLISQGHEIQGGAKGEANISDLVAGFLGGLGSAIDAVAGAGPNTNVWDVIQAGFGRARSPDWRGGDLAALRSRDKQVRLQEEIHHKMAGPWAVGSPRYTEQIGLDGKFYATSGEVMLDVNPIHGDPHATMAKMAQIERAAMAPAMFPGAGGVSEADEAIASRANSLRHAAAAAAMPAKFPGGSSPAASGGVPGSAGGPLRITGTLTLKEDGTADIDAGWNTVGSPAAPPAL